MSKKTIDVTVESAADPAAVYALLRAGETWPTWSPITSYELVKAAPGADGVGEIRIFHTKQVLGTVHSREEVVELIPDRRVSYTLEHGMPLRNYRADVDLTPTATGTAIRWHSTFDPAVPGTGWFYRAVLSAFIARCARGLATHAVNTGFRSGSRPG
jgi:uncharacterized protein YndB with AHSA1/START domain